MEWGRGGVGVCSLGSEFVEQRNVFVVGDYCPKHFGRFCIWLGIRSDANATANPCRQRILYRERERERVCTNSAVAYDGPRFGVPVTASEAAAWRVVR